MDTLRRIYNRKPRTSGWYKKGQRREDKDKDKDKDAQCPDDRTLSVSESYWNEFGCSPLEQPFKRGEKSRAAKTCASERMAPRTPDNTMYESTPSEMWTHVPSSKKLKSKSKKTTRRRKRTPPKHD